MEIYAYREAIVNTLQGKLPGRQRVLPQRLDRNHTGAVLDLYDLASGADRDNLITALREILREGERLPADTVAQVVEVASSLDLAQVEPEVAALKQATDDPALLTAVKKYLAFRHLRTRLARL